VLNTRSAKEGGLSDTEIDGLIAEAAFRRQEKSPTGDFGRAPDQIRGRPRRNQGCHPG